MLFVGRLLAISIPHLATCDQHVRGTNFAVMDRVHAMMQMYAGLLVGASLSVLATLIRALI